MNLDTLKGLFREHGVTLLLAKRLAENDNSKNQVYLAGSFEVLNLLPIGTPEARPSANANDVIHAPMAMSWLTASLEESPAPGTKLILYPQYPEVRLSGFLQGSDRAPSQLMNSGARIRGRVLFLGVRRDRTVLAHVVAPDDPVAVELEATGEFAIGSLLIEIAIETRPGREILLERLAAIAREDWLDSARLDGSGVLHPCNAPNCGGLTLEAQLGIASNSKAEPDFHGWEVKQFSVTNFVRFAAKSPVTLFTPEPTIGVYASDGVIDFIRRFGYEDTKGRADRLNVGGKFCVGRRSAATGLTLTLVGFDAKSGRISDATGGLRLLSDDGTLAAGWPFTSLIEHWNRKHAQAAYVPSSVRENPRQYRFASTVFLGEGTDFGLFLTALAAGLAYYDPGIKLEAAGSARPKAHRRSQFRIAFRKLDAIYRAFEPVALSE